MVGGRRCSKLAEPRQAGSWVLKNCSIRAVWPGPAAACSGSQGRSRSGVVGAAAGQEAGRAHGRIHSAAACIAEPRRLCRQASSSADFPRGSSSPERSERQPQIPVARIAQTAPQVVLRTCAGRPACVHFGRSATDGAPRRRRARLPCCAEAAQHLRRSACSPPAGRSTAAPRRRGTPRGARRSPLTVDEPLLARASNFLTLPRPALKPAATQGA